MNITNEGLAIIEKLAATTQKSSEANDTIVESITKTHKSAEKISEFSNVIADISVQTNLLALNAAIEAARAGEAGKGFAVVAEEIRKLAEQSTNSTKYIDEAVQELISDAKSSVSTMEEVVDVIREQRQSVADTSEQFNALTKAIEMIDGKIHGLTEFSSLMTAEKNKIVDVMQTLSAIAEENAASSDEASASTDQQRDALEEMAHASSELSSLAQNLNELTKRFSI